MEGLPMTRGGLVGSALRPAGPAPSLAPCSTTMAGTAPPGRAVTVAGAFAVAVAAKATLGGLLRRRRGQRETRATRVACAAVPTEKPFRTTLFTKAAPDGVSLGNCPFSHAVQIALRMDLLGRYQEPRVKTTVIHRKVKGVDYDVVPCGPNNKPPWLLQEVAGQMPCVVHQGIAHVKTSQILKWIDMTFPGPSLAVPEDYAQLVSRAAIFPAVAEFTKNSDSSKDDDLLVNLQMSLTRFRMHLFALPIGTRYAVSDTLTLADCELLAALYVIQSATASLKGWSLNDLPEKDEVRQYYERAAALPAFSQSCYPPNVGVQGWQMARQ